jgi:large subunit ribosomal protein L18
MASTINRNYLRKKRQLRMRNRLRGTAQRPRVSIFSSLTNISVQLIDDAAGKTLCSASTTGKEFKEKKIKADSVQAAKELGGIFVQKIKDANIEVVVFDRSGYKYHGKVKAVAETLREAGIKL